MSMCASARPCISLSIHSYLLQWIVPVAFVGGLSAPKGCDLVDSPCRPSLVATWGSTEWSITGSHCPVSSGSS
eukprot:15440633-Alexandrium_andersonii.AAC.1